MSVSPPLTRKVQLLPPQVSEKIAAGEVIERPASVVKELVENSIDAGATEIAVILEKGGKSLIEVIDNGSGMSPDDLALSLDRHATSKIRELDDLDRLSTMGFRGEALPSIAAVSELKLTSRASDSPNGDAWEVDASTRHQGPVRAQPVTFGHFLGAPHGTRIQARGLFAQVPARLKFLKSQGAEVAHVREWIERLALTNPQVGFRLISDDRTILQLRPQSEEDRVRAILADGESYPLLTASTDLGIGLPAPFRIRAHWLQGLSTPQTRKLVQVVNRRAVRDRLLQQAMLGPFRQALLPGQFPAVALFLEVDPSRLDVNVHPTKTELRFLNSREIFHAVQVLIEDLIARHGASGYVTGAGSSFAGHSFGGPTTAPSFAGPTTQSSFGESGFTGTAIPNASNFGSWRASESRSFGGSFSSAPTTPGSMESATPLPSSPWTFERKEETSRNPFEGARFRGILFDTYLLLEHSAEELVLVDQHAAHERIRYEALRAKVLSGEAKAGSQALLIPEAVKFPAEERAILQERLALLESMGFEAEIFGEDTVLFRGIPGDWGTQQLRPRLKSLIERLRALETAAQSASDRALLIDEALFEKLASEACHSSVRAGDALEPMQAQSLIDRLFECQHPWNCPHGRPTTVRIPRGRFEEWFQRRV